MSPRAEKTLPSSLNIPTSAALLSSEALNVLTVPAPSTAESVSDNEGERDGEEDGGEEDDDYSDNDLEIVLEQSGTANSTGAASGGTEAPVKKVKITLSCCVQNRRVQLLKCIADYKGVVSSQSDGQEPE